MLEDQLLMVATVFIFTLLSAKIDADSLNQGYRFKDHSVRWVQRGLVVAALSQQGLWLFLLNTALFYLVFDYTLNVLRGLPVLYIGSVAHTDRLWTGKPVLQLIFKTIFFITTLILFLCN